MNDNTTETAAARDARPLRPELRFFHPTGKGTGCAMTLALHPAHDTTDGSIFMALAAQLTVGDRRGPVPTFPRFDWENRITVKLDFADLSKMLQVFRGECESLEDGKGLYHRSARYVTRIVLRHLVEPVPGYSLEVYRSSPAGDGEQRAHMLLSPWEALGISESIAGALAVVSFGIPAVIPREVRAAGPVAEGGRNEIAA